jgi:hypothetical protein
MDNLNTKILSLIDEKNHIYYVVVKATREDNFVLYGLGLMIYTCMMGNFEMNNCVGPTVSKRDSNLIICARGYVSRLYRFVGWDEISSLSHGFIQQIQDVYSFILEELKEFMKAELEGNQHLSTVVCGHLTRKIVKGIFMPIIYGKTLMSTAHDLKDHLSHFITHTECFEVAAVCFKFWRSKYKDMECLIRLIRHIGWVASARDCPVFYKVPYFTTVQDYMVMEAINIWVRDKLHKKRRRVTLRVSSSKRDRRKTEISTFVNFIHQRDAQIAMNVVDVMLGMGAPIYTVHDNFLTTSQYSIKIPKFYSSVFRNMGPPLSIINEFIYMNVIKPIVKRESDGPTEGCFASKVIPTETLNYYLKANVPENISKKMKATWGERITGLVTSYEDYTRYVSGNYRSPNPRECWEAHEQKWEKFQLQLRGGDEIPYFCVHY